MKRGNEQSRRRMLQLAGATATGLLAGCGGGGDGGGGVPDQYRTAASQGGQQRDPENLATKDALNYQDSPKNDQRCSGCTYYIEDKNGDGMGACTLVEGTIDPEGWCSSYAAYEG
jgi:hypothetical protein